jgi:hypothetical protein
VSTEPITASVRTQELGPAAAEPDPLAKITLSRRGFTALLATIGLLVGLILALVPVHVAGPDPARPASVSCGNTIGGVESGSVAANLDHPDRPTMTAYVGMCEQAISDRLFYSWPLFFAGALVIVYLGVVRRPGQTSLPGFSTPSGSSVAFAARSTSTPSDPISAAR